MGVAAKVLAEQLQRYGHGDALWDPAPTTDEEVRLGDVGIIDEEGSFMRLFNVMVDAKDSLNKGGVPDGFKPLILNKRLQKFMPQCHAPGPLTSSTIGHTSAKGHAGANVGNIAGGGAMYQFACSSECGAWLLLKDFSDKTYLLDTGNLKKYMLQHHDAWYNFATGESLGIDCKPYDIILVKGFVKTSAWAVAAYKSGVRSTQAMSLTGTVGGVGEAGFEFRVDSSEGYMFDTRYGPEGRDAKALQSSRQSISSMKGKGRELLEDIDLADGSSTTVDSVPTVFPRDQSVFLSYYKIKQRMWWKKIVAHAGPHVLPRGPNEEQNTAVMTDMEGSIEEVPGRQLQHLPIDQLLDYIFENSDAEIAIASHDDITNLFPEQFLPENFAAWLKEHSPPVTVDQDKLGYLATEDYIVATRTEALLNAVARQDLVEEEEQNKQTAIANALQELKDREDQLRRTQEEQGNAQKLALAGGSHDSTEASEIAQQHDSPVAEVIQAIVDEQAADATVAIQAQSPPPPPPPPPQLSQYVELSLFETRASVRSATAHRQYGSSVELDGKVYLGKNKLLKYSHMVLFDHAADGCAVTTIALSVSTKRIASACEDCAVRVWDLETGALVMKLDGHRESTYAVAFSPDGSRLVSGGADHKAILWNLDNHNPVKQLDEHTGDVWMCDYSPDGKYIATGSTDCTVKLWSGTDDGDAHALFTLQDHTAVVMTVAFSPDSQHLLTCADGLGRLWSTQDGSLLADMEGHTGLIWSAKFSPDGTRIVTAAEDHTVRVWNVEDGLELVTLREHSGPVWTAAFSPDGNDVVSGSYDGQVVLCDSFTGVLKHRLEDDHPAIVNTVTYSRDGELVAAGCAGGAVKLWNVKDGKFLAEFLGHDDKVKDVLFSPDDCQIISCSDDSTVRIWNVVDPLQF